MFNLTDIQQRNDRNVLQYFEKADSSIEYSYADLYRHSIEISSKLKKILIKTISNQIDSPIGCNIAILLPVHSPALLPALVG